MLRRIMKIAWDELWLDIRLATMVPGGAAYGAIPDGALAVKDGRIAWVGPRAALPPGPAGRAGRRPPCGPVGGDSLRPRPLADPRADRLPHPYSVRRRALQGVRAAPR